MSGTQGAETKNYSCLRVLKAVLGNNVTSKFAYTYCPLILNVGFLKILLSVIKGSQCNNQLFQSYEGYDV